jgi:hypothetical protein
VSRSVSIGRFPANLRFALAEETNPLYDVNGLRTVEAATLFESKMLLDAQPLLWDDAQTSGAGTSSAFVANNSKVRMSVSANTAGKRVRQTFQAMNYQSGKVQRVKLTWVPYALTAGITRKYGYFNDNNGLFFKFGPTSIDCVIRSFTSGAVVDRTFPQSSWNPNKYPNLDPTKIQFLVIEFIWLSAGTVRFGFYSDGKITYVHEVHHANVLDVPYMQYPNLPIRCSIENDGTGPAAFVDHICGSVESLGGNQKAGSEFTVDTLVTPLTTANNQTLYPVLAVRLNASRLQSSISVLKYGIFCSTNALIRHALLLNPTFAGTALSFSAVTNTALDVARPTNATTISGGTQVDADYFMTTTSAKAGGGREIDSNIRMGASIAGTPDIMVVAGQRITGGAEDLYANLTWREQ